MIVTIPILCHKQVQDQLYSAHLRFRAAKMKQDHYIDKVCADLDITLTPRNHEDVKALSHWSRKLGQARRRTFEAIRSAEALLSHPHRPL